MDGILLHLQEWLERNKSRSIPLFAKNAGVAASTIRRFLNREQDLQEATARKILRVTANPKTFIHLMSQAYPDTNEHLLFASSEDRNATDVCLSYYYQDPTSFDIFVATSNDHGYDEKKLIRKLGTNGKKRIAELLDSGEITLRNGRLFTEQVMFTSEESILQACSGVPSLIRANMDKMKGIYFCTDRYSDSDLVEIADAMKTFVTTMQNINRNRKEIDENSKPSCVSIMFGSLDGEDRL